MSLLSSSSLDFFSGLNDVLVLHDSEVTKFSTMKLSSQGTLIKVSTVDSLKDVIFHLREKGTAYRVIGWGANFILPENPDFVLIKLDLPFDKSLIKENQNRFYLPASAPLNVLTSLAQKFNFSGWEVFTGVPASLGGAIAMNAGTSLGEICELINYIDIMRSNGDIERHKVNESSFSYRTNHFLSEGDIIIAAEIFHKGKDPAVSELIKEYLRKRSESQPLREKTCGCMFKNLNFNVQNQTLTCRAGLYLDIMGMKGLSVGDMRISPKHANFMENRGRSGSEEVKKLVNKALSELELHYGVKFETEVHLP